MASQFDERLLELAWSLWAEFGVPGWEQRRHRDTAIDPESLIVFTAAISEVDSRLRDEAMGWCIAFDRLISTVRLKNVVKQQSDDDMKLFYRFAAALNDSAELDWPAGGHRSTASAQPRTREWSRDFSKTASSVALRLRAIFGVSARAEALGVFLAYPDAALSAPEMAPMILYIRRNVALALEALQIGGLIDSLLERNSLRYMLSRRAAFVELAAPVPTKFPAWSELLRLLLDMRHTLSTPKKSSLLRSMQARDFIEAHAYVIARTSLPIPPSIGPDSEGFPDFEEWALQCVTLIAANHGDVLETPKLRPTYLRLRRPRGGTKRALGVSRRKLSGSAARG